MLHLRRTGNGNTFTPEKTGKASTAGQTPGSAAKCVDGLGLHFFDAEFTNQQLSLSMLEDTLMSNGETPVRTGANSRDEGGVLIDRHIICIICRSHQLAFS